MSHASGRWPANVILTHHPACVCRGTRKVKGASKPIQRPEGFERFNGQDYAGGEKYHAPAYESPGYASPDGTETVEAWDCHPDCPVGMLDEQSGELPGPWGKESESQNDTSWFSGKTDSYGKLYRDTGGASRFFYCAKASRRERGRLNKHPTVKPVDLMEYLCKLTRTPTGGIVLDPFLGSGTTAVAAKLTGRRWIGIEQDARHADKARRRVARTQAPLFPAPTP